MINTQALKVGISPAHFLTFPLSLDCKAVIAIWSLLLGASFCAAQVPSLGTATAKDFKNEIFYPPPNLNQVKSVIKGGQGRQLTNNLIALTLGVGMETFRTNGQRELRLEATECIYDTKARVAFSPGSIKAESGDGKYTIAGEGFFWRQSDTSFFISNRVHSTVDTAVLNAKSARTNQAGADHLDIFSDRFTYDRKAGLATYDGHLRVTGTNLLLTASTLKIKLPADTNGVESLSAEGNVVFNYDQIHATGERALYTTASNLVQLFGNPQWRAGEREGRGDVISVDRTNKILRATGNAYLKIPAAGNTMFLAGKNPAATNAPASTNRFMEIFSDSYTIQTNRAVFSGSVRATEMVRTDNQLQFLSLSKLMCSMLIVELSSSNEVQRAVAELDVVIEQGDKRFTADSAVYTATNGILLLRGSPTWRAGLREGRGDELRVDTLKEQMQAKGNAWMKLPAGEIAIATPGSTNSVSKNKPQSGTNTFAEIFCDNYTFQTNHAEFRNNVRIEHPQMIMTCETVDADFSEGNVDKRVVARQGVIIDVLDQKGEKYRGTGDKAVYTYRVTDTTTNDTVELMENPMLKSARGTSIGDVITLDRISGKIVVKNSRSFIRAGAFKTNSHPAKTNSP